MYAIKKLILFLAFWITASPLLYAQYFDKMSVKQRDSVLVAKAKEVISQHASDCPKNYGEPFITYEITATKASIRKEAWGRGFYSVIFPYVAGKKPPSVMYDFAIRVTIWADTGLPLGLATGTGVGRIIEERPTPPPPEPIWEVGYVCFDEASPETFTVYDTRAYLETMGKSDTTQVKKYRKFIVGEHVLFLIKYHRLIHDKKEGHSIDTLPASVLDRAHFRDLDTVTSLEHRKDLFRWQPYFRELYIIEKYSKDSVIRTQVLFRPDKGII